MSENQENQIVERSSAPIGFYHKENMDSISRMVVPIAEAKVCGVKTQAEAYLLAVEVVRKGLSIFDLSSKYHFIQGVWAIRADYALAQFLERGGDVLWKKYDKEEARAIFYKGKNEIEMSFSFEDAKEAGYCFGKKNCLKDNWKHSRPDMLRARVISKSVRMLDPVICNGFYTKEEVLDFGMKNEVAAVPEQVKKGTETLFSEGDAKKDAKSTDSDLKSKKEDAVDAEVVEVEESAKSTENADSEETPKEEPKSEEKTEEAPKDSKDSKEKTILEKFEEQEEQVNFFLLKKKMIQEKQTFRDLPENKIKMIEGRGKGFFDAVKNLWKLEKQK